jgi:uncharacterized membrane protein
VLTIRLPHPSDVDAGKGLLTLLTQQWRNFMAFVLSFMLVGIWWHGSVANYGLNKLGDGHVSFWRQTMLVSSMAPLLPLMGGEPPFDTVYDRNNPAASLQGTYSELIS